jgi:serine/threonine protein kinase
LIHRDVEIKESAMPDWNPQANNIFLDALEIENPEERRVFIEKACGGDAELLTQVDSLLAASQNAGRFLQTAPMNFGNDSADPLDLRPLHQLGSQIGPYRLLKRIGEGGMGTVFLAEQTVPVQRRVALKVIKSGMDSRQAVARFAAERQALTLMDHVNIARVLDGGATESGQPYFVMELIDGVPITAYCDKNQLTPRERLELFVPVCQAIQHAHQKGIIHRDIKPSNVLVTLYDGRPVPKVIDFGVAKAIEQKLTEHTLFTQHGTLIGTLEYMSPEQAVMSEQGIDTRTDIYSLGVLLYELLTGSTPLSHNRVREAAYIEILRLIQNEEPPKPSTRLSDSGEALASISAQRHMEPAKLTKLVRGELDWIVMKTLEKDRNRRYESASGFAIDVQRYLADEPVSACPPSAMYRFQKFARRNKKVLMTILLVSLSLVFGTIVSTWQAVRATNAEQLAEQRFVGERQARIEAEQAHNLALANLRKAHEAVDRLLTRVGENELFQTPHLQQLQRKLLEDALEFNEGFLAITGDDPELQLEAAVARLRVGIINLQIGEFRVAEEACQFSLDKLRSLSEILPGDSRPRAEMVRACQNLGFIFDRTQPEGSQREEIRRHAVRLIDQLIEDFPERKEFQLGRASSYLYLGVVLMNNNKQQEAESVLRRALDWSKELEIASLIGQCCHELARLYFDSNRLDQAEASERTAIEVFRQLDDGRGWYNLPEATLR